MSAGTNGSRLVVALVLLASTAFFVMGTVQEHKHVETTTSTETSSGETQSETAEERAAETAGTPSDSHTEVKADLNEKEAVFGVNIEAAWLIALAAGLSVLLALAVLLTRSRYVLLAVALVCVVFVALDVREVVHQVDEASAGLIVIAVLTMLGHLTSGGLAGLLALRPADG